MGRSARELSHGKRYRSDDEHLQLDDILTFIDMP